jgi:hypothetical protein
MTRQQILITNFDFELRQICKAALTANGAAYGTGGAPSSPFAMWLYDSNNVQRSNIPVLAELLCNDKLSQPTSSQTWPSPPIMYRVNSYLVFDVYTLIPSTINPALLPVTVNMLFRGVRRIPCQ